MGQQYGPLFTVLILLFVVFGGLFYWWLLCVVVSHAGGWARLAPSYPAKARPKEGLLKWQTLRVGRCSYLRVATIAATAEGLYLAVGFFFRPAHPPLFMPWDKIIERRTLHLGTGTVEEITLPALPVGASLQIPIALAERLGLSRYLPPAAEEPTAVEVERP